MLSLRLPGGMATPVGCRPAEFLGLLSGDGAESVLGAGADARSRVVDGGAEVGGGGVGPPGVELEPAGGDRGLGELAAGAGGAGEGGGGDVGSAGAERGETFVEGELGRRRLDGRQAWRR